MTIDFYARALAANSFCDLMQDNIRQFGDLPALRSHDTGETLTWREYGERVEAVAAGLAGLGVQRGDTVGIMLTNRIDFHVYDAAAFHLGAAPFSIYNTNTVEQINFVVDNADNRVMVTEPTMADRVREACEGTLVEHLVCLDEQVPGFITHEEVLAAAPEDFDFEAAWRAVTRDDLVTITYTSGTTGPPKGVETTHQGPLFFLENVLGEAGVAEALHHIRTLSYLPDAHTANRCMAHYAAIAGAGTITTLADLKQLTTALPATRPTAFLGAPTLWYKLRTAIEGQVQTEKGVKGTLARWAVDVGRTHALASAEGRPISGVLKLKHKVADTVVLSKIRAKIGLDETILPATGTAPIATEALEFILALGVPVCEGWAMTETCMTGTLNRPSAVRLGTVGPTFPGVEAKVADDGELLVRSNGLMRGYRKQPEKTAETIDPDGWLHTGDVATIDEDGYVTIVDRKKELIISASGKNMSPGNIEGAMRAALPILGAAIAIGDNRPYVTALLALDPDGAATFAEQHGLDPNDPAAIARSPQLLELIEAGIEKANASLSGVERVRAWAVAPEFWQPGGDELTPTMKLRRKPIGEKYAAEIDGLYSAKATV